MRRWLALIVACAALPAHALTLGELAATLATVDASRARFVEIRTLAALGTPIERRGTLAYNRPGKLEMIVDTPIAERMTIADGTMTVESRGTKYTGRRSWRGTSRSTRSHRTTC